MVGRRVRFVREIAPCRLHIQLLPATRMPSHTTLARHIVRILRQYHLSIAHARIVANAIADAEARGITSHGVRRLPNYIERLRAGAINPVPHLHWHITRRGTAVLDADHAFGHVATHYAARRLVTMTRRTGIAAVGIRRCEHMGALDTPLRTLVTANLVTLIMVNTPPAMAPIAGHTAILGSNPIAIGIPGTAQPLMIFDGATTRVARSKVVAAATAGQTIPTDWAIDAHGNATSDPHHALAGALLPAGTLGYGMGLSIALLTGAMIGGVSDDHLPSFLQAPHQPVPTSVLMIGIDPDAFGGLTQLQHVGGALVTRIRADRGQARIPGDMRHHAPIPAAAWDVIQALQSA
jgi:LDH2 family malate/lactate/ureidoglycolate dehydrogenase